MQRDEAISQIRILWPYLTFFEKCTWVDVFRSRFGGDFADIVELLSGEKLP